MQVKLSEQEINCLKQAKDGIISGPRWQFTDEGYSYWSEVVCKLYSKIQHGTSDGKPWQEPVDEPIATPFEECKCDMRTRLVGDGCEVCNPELAKELSRPDSDVHGQCKQPVPSPPRNSARDQAGRYR
jgi:hypothetical protein